MIEGFKFLEKLNTLISIVISIIILQEGEYILENFNEIPDFLFIVFDIFLQEFKFFDSFFIFLNGNIVFNLRFS